MISCHLNIIELKKKFLMKPRCSEISDDEIELWKEFYNILKHIKELDMRIYINSIKTNPKLKGLLNQYLVHKHIVPHANCIYIYIT